MTFNFVFVKLSGNLFASALWENWDQNPFGGRALFQTDQIKGTIGIIRPASSARSSDSEVRQIKQIRHMLRNLFQNLIAKASTED